MITWIEDHCPKCYQPNWVNNGDSNDYTENDIDGSKCWSCGYCWPLVGEEDWEDASDDLYYTLGKNFTEIDP